MDAANLKVAASIVSSSYVNQVLFSTTIVPLGQVEQGGRSRHPGCDGLARRHKIVKTLLSSRRLPANGWDEANIEMFIQDCALMDSNNFVDNVGVGEREGRVLSSLVARRHYRLSHGIGRSGDIAAEQPKAAGSSLLAKLTNFLVMDAMNLAGLEDMGACTVLPLATGMTVTVALLALKAKRPPTARYVLWPRIDQKTCAKAVLSAGLELIVVPMSLHGDELRTDLAAVEMEIDSRGADSIVCVLSTTSCFAPRSADSVVELAKLCKAKNVGHLINNAYGVQARPLCKLVTSAWRKGRVDGIIQSTDKNFMVPVGGAILCAGKSDPSLVHDVNKAYPGRASMSALLDVLITLLSLGASGWQRLLHDREDIYQYMEIKLTALAEKHGERLLYTPGNPISMGMTLANVEESALADITGVEAYQSSRNRKAPEGYGNGGKVPAEEGEKEMGLQALYPSPAKAVTFIGAMLFSRSVSGIRTIPRGVVNTVAGVEFTGFGSSHDAFPTSYLTAAAAIGTTRDEVDTFCSRLSNCLDDMKKKLTQNREKWSKPEEAAFV